MAARFVTSGTPHHFDSAREAIDAVSAFEHVTEFDWRYNIQLEGWLGWRVDVSTDDYRAYLAPAA